MGLAIGGLQSGGGGSSANTVIAGSSTALQFISTQVSGSDGYRANTAGARWHIGPGTTDYIFSDGLTKITFAGDMSVTGTITPLGSIRMVGGQIIRFDTANSTADLSSVAGSGVIRSSATLSPFSDIGFNLGSLTLRWSDTFSSVTHTETLTITTKGDSTGTPGNATLNTGCGKSAIASGASACVVGNTMVSATSLVMFSMLGVDATGLLPRISNIGAGTFTLTVSAVCTGNLSFQWFIIQ